MKSAAPITALEFFSGIGGMRLSLQGAVANLPTGRSGTLSGVIAVCQRNYVFLRNYALSYDIYASFALV